MIGRALRTQEGGGLAFFCPGCKEFHAVHVGTGPGPRWSWNGSLDAPTFAPSILARSGHYADGNDQCWCTWADRFPDEPQPPFTCYVCHSFVRDGQIQFLSDCTHALAGKTVPLPAPEYPRASSDVEKQESQ